MPALGRRWESQRAPHSSAQTLELYLNAAVLKWGVAIKPWDPGDQDAVRCAVEDMDFSGWGRDDFDVDLYTLGHRQSFVVVGLTAEDCGLCQTSDS